jgi:hypothetical protein
VIPFRNKRMAVRLRYLSVALGGAAMFVAIGGLILTTTPEALLRAAMFALGFIVSAGIVYGASLRLLWMFESQQEADDDERAATP